MPLSSLSESSRYTTWLFSTISVNRGVFLPARRSGKTLPLVLFLVLVLVPVLMLVLPVLVLMLVLVLGIGWLSETFFGVHRFIWTRAAASLLRRPELLSCVVFSVFWRLAGGDGDFHMSNGFLKAARP